MPEQQNGQCHANGRTETARFSASNTPMALCVAILACPVTVLPHQSLNAFPVCRKSSVARFAHHADRPVSTSEGSVVQVDVARGSAGDSRRLLYIASCFRDPIHGRPLLFRCRRFFRCRACRCRCLRHRLYGCRQCWIDSRRSRYCRSRGRRRGTNPFGVALRGTEK